MKKYFSFLLISLIILPFSKVSAATEPGSVYCHIFGGKLSIKDNNILCILEDKTECDPRDYKSENYCGKYVDLPCKEFKYSVHPPAEECCEGLIPIPDKAQLNLNLECKFDCAGDQRFFCSKCGDNKCDKELENECNCPEDCPGSSPDNITKNSLKESQSLWEKFINWIKSLLKIFNS